MIAWRDEKSTKKIAFLKNLRPGQTTEIFTQHFTNHFDLRARLELGTKSRLTLLLGNLNIFIENMAVQDDCGVAKQKIAAILAY